MYPLFGLLRRDYSRGSRFDRPMDYYRRNIYPDLYIDSPANDPRIGPRVEFGDTDRGGRRFDGIRRRGPLPIRSGFVEEDDDTPTNREMRQSQDMRKPNRPSAPMEHGDHYGDPSRLGSGPDTESLPFGKAMHKLHRQLLQAEEFYGNFQTEYDNDTEKIQRYANEKILSMLWVLRVGGIKNSAATLDEQDDENDDLADTTEKFSAMKKKVVQTLQDAIHSNIKEGTAPGRKSKIRLENGRRMRDKLITANQLILELLNSTPEARDDCKALIHELGQLKTLIDPDVEENKELYKGGDCTSEGSGSVDSRSTGGRATWE